MTAVGDARKRGAEKTNRAAHDAQGIAQEPPSPTTAPESTDNTNGPQRTNLSAEQMQQLRRIVHTCTYDCADQCSPDEADHDIADAVAEFYADIVREHRAEVLAEAERRIDGAYRAYLSSSGLSPDWIAGWHSSNLHAAHVVRTYRKEQNHG